MSSELPEEFRYLVLFAVLSGRSFTKSELGIKMTNPEIRRHNSKERLLAENPKGRSLHLSATPEGIRWTEKNLKIDPGNKTNKVLKVLAMALARTDAYLTANRISLEEFLKPGGTKPSSDPVDAVRQAYLAISGGAYDARVLLKDLRKRLTLSRDEQDDALLALMQSTQADLYSEDDPMSRDEEDDRAALTLADRRRHIIQLHREQRA